MPRQPKRPTLALVVAVLGAAAALFSGSEMIGTPIRWVHVVGLFASGLASGAGIVKAKLDWRAARAAAATSRVA